MAVTYRIGTSGFSYAHWRDVFYPRDVPPSGWLEHYTQRFPTVELNNSFYRLPKEETFKGWRRRTPEGFLFAVKASRVITHLRRLSGVEEALQTFVSRAALLQEKLGPLLYQLPPGLGTDLELLRSFLGILPRGLSSVMEFRDRSWYQEPVLELMAQHNVAFCVHDLAGVESPVRVTADFAYFRFHGPSGRYAGSYSGEQLQEWAGRIKELGAGPRVVYVYFNNDMGGHAVNNAQTLAGLLL